MTTGASSGAQREKDQTELGRHEAGGSCPHCGGKVSAVDVRRPWRMCFVPVGFEVKRRYVCTQCSRRLVALYSSTP